MEEIERHLRALCERDARLRLLEAQWEYDKRLVQQALQTIGGTFPHYSLHDSSHSNTILVNVTRILGTRVTELSATDTWLLLEAAYWHDIGMVVSDQTLRNWWHDAQFKAHLAELRESSDPMLSASARILGDLKNVSDLGQDWPLDIRQALVFVAADYARKRHPLRAAEAVRSPTGFSVASPRILIPNRLFEWLSSICLGHGQSREEVSKLPHCENGIGPDFCHPRFVAYLLRLGDLLDLDNGRFCSVLLSGIGRVPPSSADHIAKHASITRFYVAPDRVDVEATCVSSDAHGAQVEAGAYGSYQAVSQWLEWLKSELTFMAVNWSTLVPSELTGGAPSIGTIAARLKGYELLPNHATSDFGIDNHYFMQLSKSSGLFGQAEQAWQREILINAADATILRIWETLVTKEERHNLCLAADPIAALHQVAAKYPVDVSIEPGEIGGEPATRAWKISVTDQGCGFSLEDVHSIQVIWECQQEQVTKACDCRDAGVLSSDGIFWSWFSEPLPGHRRSGNTLPTHGVEGDSQDHHSSPHKQEHAHIGHQGSAPGGLCSNSTKHGIAVRRAWHPSLVRSPAALEVWRAQ